MPAAWLQRAAAAAGLSRCEDGHDTRSQGPHCPGGFGGSTRIDEDVRTSKRLISGCVGNEKSGCSCASGRLTTGGIQMAEHNGGNRGNDRGAFRGNNNSGGDPRGFRSRSDRDGNNFSRGGSSGGGERKSFGDRDRKPFGDRPRRPFGDRPRRDGEGERRQFGDRDRKP